jgi:hypothetical protein
MLHSAQAVSTGFSPNHPNQARQAPNEPAGNGQTIASLSIWPALAHLLKARQYEQAAELLLKTQLARQPMGSEANVAFLLMAQEIYQAYRHYQSEIA